MHWTSFAFAAVVGSCSVCMKVALGMSTVQGLVAHADFGLPDGESEDYAGGYG